MQRLEKLVEKQLDIPLLPNLGEGLAAEGASVPTGEPIEKNFELFAMVPLQKLQDRGL